ncbi:MAG: threonine synthase [Kiritimatiellae bacterium]|nr:threonine synthase [Kiritimatiellia bacterium]
MKFTSTRSTLAVDSLPAILRGLAPDGGLFVPSTAPAATTGNWSTLADAERAALGAFFDDVHETVREDAIRNLLSKFPADDPIPLVDADGFKILELFHGPTGAFKDVALSVLPVFMTAAAQGKRVLILTATSGDTGSAAMAGFANVPGVEIAVFFPHTGTSRIQKLQMTTPSAPNVHGIAIRGNFDDAQAAVKRIFSDPAIRAEAEAAGITLSSANSINIGRLVPQVAYYLHAAAKTKTTFDVVVPSGNFGNILAAYYAKQLGAPIRKFVCASNVNDVLTRFIATGTYDPGPTFTVTNSPSMDIRKSSNVERLLWAVNDGDGAAVKKLMDDFAATGRYTLSPAATAKLQADFVGAFATPEETEAEMRLLHDHCGYIVDPHTAVATAVARKLGYPKDGLPCVVAATATPYKFPETCLRAFGTDILTNPPASFVAMEKAPITQKQVVDVAGIDAAVRALFR